jgi:hypothetical protein
MAETAQVRFTSKGEDSIPFDVLSGKESHKVPHIVTLHSKCNGALTFSEILSGITDAAFTRTDYLESFRAKDPVNGARLRILNPVTPPPILDGEPFPFETTSELYPEYGLLAGRHVEWELQREVLTALLKLNKNDTVCDDMHCRVDTNTHTHIYTHIYIHTHTHTYIYIYNIYTYIYKYIHIYKYIYI